MEGAFADVPRPQTFIRGTCVCEECIEHNDTLEGHTPESVTVTELGNPGWDPICAANDQAFAYYLPAMVRLAFETHYHDQLLFHLDMPDRLKGLSQLQTEVLLAALWLLAEVKEEEIFGSFDEYALGRVIGKLEQKLAEAQ